MKDKISSVTTGFLVKGYVGLSVISSKFSKQEKRRHSSKIRKTASLAKLHPVLEQK